MKDEKNQDDSNKYIHRKPGTMKGQIKISDEFYEPMREEELALWYDSPIFPEDETHNDQTGE